MKTPVILLVDDEEAIVKSLKGSLEDEGYIVLTASDGIKALEIIKAQPVDSVFLDIWLPEMDGIETLGLIKDYNSSINVVMMTGHGTVNTAVQAVKLGAFDFLEKPFDIERVIDIIKRIKEMHIIKIGNIKDAETPSDANLVLSGETPAVLQIKKQIHELSNSSDYILVHGEIGTGKELVSRLIHYKLKNNYKLFKKLNCAIYGPDDVELELFGSKKSIKDTYSKTGILKDCANATIFLDSIDSLSPETQKRLANELTAIKDKNTTTKVIAATTIDIERDRDSEDKKLTDELLNVFTGLINLPPLRKRRGDIPLLAHFFLNYFCKEYGFREKNFDDDALETLVNYDWLGNVKELKNLIEKLVVSVPTKNIFAHDIPFSARDESQFNLGRYYEGYRNMEEAEAAWRKNYILYFLRKNDKDIKKTADKLHINVKALNKLIKEYGIVLSSDPKSEKIYQKTLKKSMVLSGRGLHSGDKTGLILTPLPPDNGIVFGNISNSETIPAHIDFVNSTDYATSLENTTSVAKTIEHLLAVLNAYGITNLMVKINNEVPIMDGSAVDFCKIIEEAGIEVQDEIVEEAVITRKHVLGDVHKNKKYIIIEPAEKFSIHYMLNYPKPVGRQEYTFVMVDSECFKNEIAPARTFGFLKDIEALNKVGLASGGRLNNFILIDDEKIVNTELRFPDEFVRHKILDMIGDLYLMGRPLRGKITANMTGHSDNIAFVRMMHDMTHL